NCTGRSAGARYLDVPLPGTMASVAADSLGDLTCEHRISPEWIAIRGDLGIIVVAEHAFITDRSPRVWLIRAIIAWTHRPRSPALRIPAERQLLQRARLRAMQERPRMRPRSHHEVDLLLVDVRLFPLKSDLVAALVIFPVALGHREIRVRSSVVE